jgi:peptide deformylase
MARLQMERGKDNQILRTSSAEVKKIDKKLLKFIEDMKVTMDLEKGVGLAAPQVGANIRVVVCKFNHDTKNQLIVPMINPEIIQKSSEMELDEEGCLSLPKQFDAIARHTSLIVRYTDIRGNEITLKVRDFNAKIVQHEVDHIDGKLYIDHLTDPETLELKKHVPKKRKSAVEQEENEEDE